MIGFGILNGDWLEARKVAKKINLIEPVVEGTLQLFFLSSILYTTQGPDQNPAENRPFDISSILFTEKTSSRILFLITFCSSFLSVGISFARLLAQGSKPVIKKIVSWQFFKILLMILSKFIMQSYMLSMAIKSLMFKFVSKFQFSDNPSFDTEEYRELEEIYYRGLCVYDKSEPMSCKVNNQSYVVNNLQILRDYSIF